MDASARNRVRHGWAWVGLSLSLAIHVADEATHDFLSVYNPAVERIRQAAPWLPLPVFRFDVWLAGLIVAVIGLLCLSLLIFRGRSKLVWLSWLFGVFMCVNALGHFAGSLYMGKAMPGVYSSPLLLAAAVNLLWSARRLTTATK